MLQALLAGVASIKAQQTRINVIGNNLANVNTTAYKGSRVTFQDMLSQTVRGATAPTTTLGGTDPVQFGLGVVVAGVASDQDQGSLESTNRQTDLAIQGGGMFMLSDGTVRSTSMPPARWSTGEQASDCLAGMRRPQATSTQPHPSVRAVTSAYPSVSLAPLGKRLR
jgi:flagellar basal body rod protein FlgC